MEGIELVIKSVEMTYHQTIARIRMRDNVILVYLAAVASIFGVSIEHRDTFEIMLIIPYLALGASIMFSHHSIFIGAALDYSSHELKNYVEEGMANHSLPLYELSLSFQKTYKPAIFLASVGSLVLIIAPCIISFIFNWNNFKNANELSMIFIWWLALISAIVAAAILIWALNVRLKNMNS